MKTIRLLLLIPLAACAQATADSSFDALFTGRTLRYDYFHTGTAGEEHISLDRVRLEGEWPGRRHHLVDES